MSKKMSDTYDEMLLKPGKINQYEEYEKVIKDLEKIILHYEEVLIGAHMHYHLMPGHPQFLDKNTSR